MHFSVAITLCDLLTQLTSILLNFKGQGQGYLVNFAKVHLLRIFCSTCTFFMKRLGLVALLTIILARTVTLCPQKISKFISKTNITL